MLTEHANTSLRDMHSRCGADPELIEARAVELIGCEALSEQDRKILGPKTRSSFFEVWSPFWLLPPETSAGLKRELGAAMLASWTGIAQIDRGVDELGVRGLDPGFRRRACIWSDMIAKEAGWRTQWPQIVDLWATADHAIDGNTQPDDIILLKNPFYPEIFRVYLGEYAAADSMSRNYTLLFGAMDEAADLMDDVSRGRANYAVRKWGVETNCSGNHRATLDELLVRNIIPEIVSECRERMIILKGQAKQSGLKTFAESLNWIEHSFNQYEEFCVARALTFAARCKSSTERATR